MSNIGKSRSRNSRPIAGVTGREKEILDRALDVVHKWSGLPKSDIVGRRRFQSLIDARHFWWMLCLDNHSFTLMRLGELVDRDHGSIVHARERHRNMLEVGAFTYGREDGAGWQLNSGRYNGLKRADKSFKANWEYLCRKYAEALANEQEGKPAHDTEHTNSLV